MGKTTMATKRPMKTRLAHAPGHIFWKKEPKVDRLSIFIERVVQGVKEGEGQGEENENERTGTELKVGEHEESELLDDVIAEVHKAQNVERQPENNSSVHDEVTAENDVPSSKNSYRDSSHYVTNEKEAISEKKSTKRNTARQKDEKAEDQEQSKMMYEKVIRVIARLYSTLFTEDLMFMRVFDIPPEDLTAEDGLYFRQIADKEFECRLFLKRFSDASACQLVFGASSDIPPGMAVYKLNDKYTNEQKLYTKEALGPCMDDEGYMSPAKIYPWFAMGISKSIRYIIEQECEDEEDSDENKENSDFAGIQIIGEFPLVKLLLPVGNEDDADDTLQKEESGTIHQKDANLLEMEESSQQYNDNGEDRGSNKQHQGGSHNSTPRSIQSGGTPHNVNKESSKAFSNCSSSHLGSEQEVEEEAPVVITIKPAIKGQGLPNSIKLQHALPKQKPYCDKGKTCIKEICKKVDDGQSMWYLEASPVKMTPNVEKSARFRSTFRKIGKVTRFWNISFKPVTELIRENMTEEYSKHEFSINLDQVKSMIDIIRAHHGWKCITDEYIDVSIMSVVKSNMLTMRSVGECTRKVLGFLHAVVTSRSCPSFLQPNVNIAQEMDENEAQWVAKEMKQVLQDIDENPAAILIYIGYNSKKDYPES